MSKLNTPVKTLAMAIAVASAPTVVFTANAEEGANSIIEEVTVTARRRVENLQDIPVSVTAFNASDIEEVGVTDLTHISEMTPNLMVQPNTGGSDGVAICMRGLCRTDFTLTEDPMVGTYLDGVYISKSVGSLFDMAELERVEILRGPQGTLYGRNTLGGAVLMHTRKPTGDYGHKVSVTAGNFGRKDAKVYAEFPIVEKVAGSLSLMSKNRDPYVENSQGSDRWDEDNLAARGALRFEPNDKMTVDYAMDWQKKRETPPAVQLTSASGTNVIHPDYGLVPGIGFGERYVGDARPDYEDEISTYGESFSDVDIKGHNLTMTFELADGLTLKSITGYRDVKNDMMNNSSGASTPFIFTHDTFDLEAKSQEFQLSGAVMDNAIDYVVGAFYFNEEGEYFNDQEIDAFNVDNLSFTGIDNTSTALFGELTWHATSQIEASFGLRYTDEDREGIHTVTAFIGEAPTYTPIPGGFVFLNTDAQTFKGVPQSYETEVDDTSVAPRLSVSYKVDDDLMTYATYAVGFKSGGFNARSFTPLQWGPYDEVKLDSYEIGMKSNWMDNRVKLNMAAFYEEITDVQAQVNSVDPDGQGGFSVVIENAAEATITGFEAEVLIRLIEGLDISAGLGYTDAEYDKFISVGVDVSDDRDFEFTPKNNQNISLNYLFPTFTDLGSLTARLDWSRQSKVRFTPKISGNDDLEQEAYDVVNARLNFDNVDLANGSFGVSLWVKNLTDEEYKIGGYEVDAGDPAVGGLGRVGISQWDEPRTYGLDVIYRFGSMK